jgi:CubicO group peptidase (beta-lactamase class C family)
MYFITITNMFHRTIALIIIGLLCASPATSQETNIKPELKTYIEQRVNNGVNPSIAMATLKGASAEFFNYGNTEMDDGKAVSKSTVYEIGSISKVFTCILLAEEVLKGRMSLDDPISKYLPTDVKVPSKNGKEITLKHLATHTSALPRMPTNFNPADMENPFSDYTTKDLYEFLSTYFLPRDVGVQYEYSNIGTGLLGHILERHTRKTYEELVVERIAMPLQMMDTKVEFSENMRKNLALGYNEELKDTKNWDIPVLAGAGALRSTTSDMVKFLRANMSDDTSDLHKAMKLTHEVHFESEDDNLKIGLGWHYANDNTIIWHNGGTGGYRAFAGFVPETQEAVVVLTNSAYSIDGIGLVQLGQDLDLKMPEVKVFPNIVEVADDILESYVGKYQLLPAVFIDISKQGKQLYVQVTGQPKVAIYPSSKNKFFFKVVEATIVFNQNDNGQIESLTLNQNGQNLQANKVD